jgi:acyl-[acyl-carrier-protein]-phospholipid O-acyltransferase/long-chain-fatty-acid--[acyl-carrier-protein] ligase
VPTLFTRFTLWLLTHTVYRLRRVGTRNVPASGPALLVCNHLSCVDALLVAASLGRSVRFLVYRTYYEHPALNWLMRRMGAIPAAHGVDAEVISPLEEARAALRDGHLVCLFAEGSVSRTGHLLPFARAFDHLVGGLNVPVIPVCLDRVWGSLVSFSGGRLFWKRPTRLRFPVTVAFGQPLPPGTGAVDARLALMELGAGIAAERHGAHETLGWHFVRTARRRWFRLAMADSTGRTLSCGRLLIAGLLLAKWLRDAAPGQPVIGLLLPSSVGGAISNVATTLAGRVPVNLNFTSGIEAMTQAIAQSDIRLIVTSRQFLEKAGLPVLPGMVYLEDVLPAAITPLGKLATLIKAVCLPASLLVKGAGSGHVKADDTATIIFSSGSTGVPKGVVLSHRNILANLDSVEQVIEVRADDMLVGVLPFFHSFGFTGTLWFPLLSGFAVVYHPNPMDAKTVGDLAEQYRGTMLISTPTFCLAYTRKCRPEQFQWLRYAIVGAEKLRDPVARAFKERFGIDLLEGYGCTEMSPVVCANLPNVDDRGERQFGHKPGSVGYPLPGIVAKIVDVNSGAGPLIGCEGLLLVKGANRMIGYLDDPDRTQQALRDGWYVTGDIGVIDEDGFIYITDRLARFSKIGGEMVPHMKVEESIAGHLGEGHTAVVTSVPDEMKGERLVVLYTDATVTPQSLWEALTGTELPRLWIPKREDIRLVESIPTLGTGKTDLRAIRHLAAELTAASRAVT